jgi:phosphoadenosine phosphosulfate reductase
MSTIDLELHSLESELVGLDLAGMLEKIGLKFPGQVVFSTSFGMEDQVITDAIVTSKAGINMFTLDTGRLFNETYAVWAATISKYAICIKTYSPEPQVLNEWLERVGPNAFYDSIENRKTCCSIRKVEPLKKALAGNRVWVTGIRAAQSMNRKEMPLLEWDEVNGIIKFHPLVGWTETEVREYINLFEVPYNPLHNKGFISIGCAPCTRAIKPGEDFRAGRWWWEDNSKKECGLHTHGSQKI